MAAYITLTELRGSGFFRDTIRRNLEAMARELARNPNADQSTWEAMVLELVELDAPTEKPS